MEDLINWISMSRPSETPAPMFDNGGLGYVLNPVWAKTDKGQRVSWTVIYRHRILAEGLSKVEAKQFANKHFKESCYEI